MSAELNIIKQEKTFEKSVVAILAIGCSKEDVTVKSDFKEDVVNRLYVKISKPKRFNEESFGYKTLTDIIEFDSEGTIFFDYQYDVKEAIVNVYNGLLFVEVPMNKERIKDVKVN